MNDAVRLILSLSLSGSILALILFAIKPVVKHRLTKKVQYFLWIIVILRFLLPISFDNSIVNRIFQVGETKVNQVLEDGSSTVTTPIKTATDTVINKVTGEEKKDNLNSSTGSAIPANQSEDIHQTGKTSILTVIVQNSFLLWLLGALFAFLLQIGSYLVFRFSLLKENKPATEAQKRILQSIWTGKCPIALVRNRLIPTPMLIGLKHPTILLPDIEFSEEELSYILLHETTHLKHFDIEIKWLTMLMSVIHWFNPISYLIRKEMNRACELACDEAVIKNLSNSQKQAYGETLISVVSESKYPLGALQATMCEEKKSLKERLLSIMHHSKKPKYIALISVFLLAGVAALAMYLGAGVFGGEENPPSIYVSTEKSETKTAMMGGFEWSYHGKHVIADAINPINFNYQENNMVPVPGNGQMILGTQKINMDKKYKFTVEEITIYKDGQPYDAAIKDTQFINDSLYLQAPAEDGDYIYSIVLNYPNRGKVTYGFLVRVGLPVYNLEAIAKFKTPYVGNNSKVIAIAGSLPVPDEAYMQRFVSLQTKDTPYGATFYYEPADVNGSAGDWPIDTSKESFQSIMETNALVAFCMIGNVENLTFAFRSTSSDGTLVEEKYDTTFTFHRAELEKKYGDLSKLGNDLNKLSGILSGKKTAFKGLELYVWRNKELTGSDDLYYTLLLGTNRSKTKEEIYDLKQATSNLDEIKKALSGYSEDTSLMIYHDKDMDKVTMSAIGDQLSGIFSSGTMSIGALE